MLLELAGQGVRVVTMRTGGVPTPGTDLDAMIAGTTLTGRSATVEDVGRVAAFLASDRARTMTAATVNVSGGALVD